jgi:CheY-like chemotaxis protein
MTSRGKKKRVLVVDDEEEIRDAFSLTIARAGYEVETAASGQEAVEKVIAAPCDLVLLDLKIPGMDGVEALRALRARSKRLRVYVVTAYYEEFLARLKHARTEGMEFELLRKPIDAAQLNAVLHEALGEPGD